MYGRVAEDRRHVVQVELDAALVRDRGQVQSTVGRAARGRDHAGRVLQALQGDDVARADAVREQIHDRLAGLLGPLVARLVGCRRASRAGQREADRLGDAGHGVGGELAAAGASRGAGDLLQLGELGVAHVADRVLADGLEHVLHGHVAALPSAGQDRAAIHEHRGYVEADHGHHQPGQRLVAAGEADQRVVGVAAHGKLDRIRNHLAADQRRLHALVAHGDAVGDRDRGEFARGAAGLGHTALDCLRLPPQRDVAGRRLVPGGHHADERPRDVVLG